MDILSSKWLKIIKIFMICLITLFLICFLFWKIWKTKKKCYVLNLCIILIMKNIKNIKNTNLKKKNNYIWILSNIVLENSFFFFFFLFLLLCVAQYWNCVHYICYVFREIKRYFEFVWVLCLTIVLKNNFWEYPNIILFCLFFLKQDVGIRPVKFLIWVYVSFRHCFLNYYRYFSK